MKQESKEFLVGTMVFAVGIFLFYLVFTADRIMGDMALRDYSISATFRDLEGVRPGAKVRVAGINVGSVTSVELKDNFTSRMVVSISRGIKLPLDSALKVQTDGLFGAKFLEVLPGAEDELIPYDGGFFMYTQDSIPLNGILEKVVNYAKYKIKQCNACMNKKKKTADTGE